MGMGRLLTMTVDGIPVHLGYYVVDHLDTTNMRILMKNGYIETTEESIHKILGLPIDGIDLESVDPVKNGDDLGAIWKAQFGKGRTSARDVQEVIKEMTDDGELFNLNFLMLVINVFGECSRAGEYKYNFLSQLKGVNMISKVNWCRYVYR